LIKKILWYSCFVLFTLRLCEFLFISFLNSFNHIAGHVTHSPLYIIRSRSCLCLIKFILMSLLFWKRYLRGKYFFLFEWFFNFIVSWSRSQNILNWKFWWFGETSNIILRIFFKLILSWTWICLIFLMFESWIFALAKLYLF